MASQNFKINTPHAAVIVWNYQQRLGSSASPRDANQVSQTIISTVSCISISTSKSKSNPQGTFQLTLAPTKNWIAAITEGSWCAILMSNEPITAADLQQGKANKVKMIGRIESVRVSTTSAEDGSRRTQYLVSGVDWGYIFNSIIYIDSNIGSENDPQTQGQGASLAIQKILFGDEGIQKSFETSSNLRSLINVFGKSLQGFTEQGSDINRLANAYYDFKVPSELLKYLNIIDSSSKKPSTTNMNDMLTLFTGSLASKDSYNNVSEAEGFLDPFTLQGSHTLWQTLIENGNPALNEMLTDLKWEGDKLRFALYNRIRPFSIKGLHDQLGPNKLRSFFQHVKTTVIDDIDVVNVNMGTNWRDKYNFVEIKPTFTDFNIFANWQKRLVQKFDAPAFQREGFRPMIVETKQFPKGARGSTAALDDLKEWSSLLQEWHFDTHKTFNGTITLVGQTNYIGVGENILFNEGLVNPTPNINQDTVNDGENNFILAHVENIVHSFNVRPDGGRDYATTIQFVRGIIVDEQLNIVGDGVLDAEPTDISAEKIENSVNVLATSETLDPDPAKSKGN